MPLPRTRKQEQVAEQLTALADGFSKRLGISRREFLRGSCGLATAFLAMNAIHGEIFSVKAEEAVDPQARDNHAQDSNGDPEFAALLVGVLIEGLGPCNVLWGTDAVLLGRPQWVIEALRRLKIFNIFERYFGVTPTTQHGNLAETTVKHMIFGANAASLFGIDPRESFARTGGDRLSKLKPDTTLRNHFKGALGYVTQ
jgi:hypothetical protein